MQILERLSCTFEHVLCADFRTSYVQILAFLMCRFEDVLCLAFRGSSYPVARLARVARFASVRHPYRNNGPSGGQGPALKGMGPYMSLHF